MIAAPEVTPVDQTTTSAILLRSVGNRRQPVTIMECLLCDAKVRAESTNRFVLRMLLGRFEGHECAGLRGL